MINGEAHVIYTLSGDKDKHTKNNISRVTIGHSSTSLCVCVSLQQDVQMYVCVRASITAAGSHRQKRIGQKRNKDTKHKHACTDILTVVAQHCTHGGG